MDSTDFFNSYASEYFINKVAPHNELHIVMFDNLTDALSEWCYLKGDYIVRIGYNDRVIGSVRVHNNRIAILMTTDDCIEAKLKFSNIVCTIKFDLALFLLDSIASIFDESRLEEIFLMSLETAISHLHSDDSISHFYTGLHSAITWTPFSDFPRPLK